MYNVIDTRQSYLQKLLKQALAALGYHEQAAHSVHYSYEMVALSHATARELGYDTSDDADRPFVEVSGRKGLGVKADDLLDRLIDKASQEVAKRNAELPPDDVRRIAEAIAIAAVRYFMVKFSRGKVIVFDIDEALSFEGESGPYLQYAVVRANNIFNKLKERAGLDEAAVVAALRLDAGRAARRRTATRRTTSGGWCSRRRGSTRSSSRPCGRWSCRCWRSTRSAWRRRSTPSITATRSSTRSAPTPGSGARRRSAYCRQAADAARSI